MKFIVEQVALCPPDPAKAIKLLTALGLDEWARDLVVAEGEVHGLDGCTNIADLAFNYQAASSKPLELEVLHYRAGNNWMQNEDAPRVSHLGMHVTLGELFDWRRKLTSLGIGVAQEVDTLSHTNPVIAGKRNYKYVIFDTHAILGVDLKFIVRKDVIKDEPALPTENEV